MQRSDGKILACVTAASALLLATTSAAWIASYFPSPVVGFGDGRTSVGYSFHLSRGGFSIQRATGLRTMSLRSSGSISDVATIHLSAERAIAGIHIVRYENIKEGDPTPYGYHVEIWFSLMVPFLISLPLAGLWATRVARRKELAPRGLCRKCGYDLRATPQRCPECGTIPIEKAAA